jgi:hypothetical protein
MRFFWRWPWVATVLAVPAIANAQVTVNDEATPAAGGRAPADDDHPVVGDDGLDVPQQRRPGAPSSTRWPRRHAVGHLGVLLRHALALARVWALNPQITNPHWIFPGDQVRLLRQGTVAAHGRHLDGPDAGGPARHPSGGAIPARDGLHPREAWASPEEINTSGTIVGAPEDRCCSPRATRRTSSFRAAPPTSARPTPSTRGGRRRAGRTATRARRARARHRRRRRVGPRSDTSRPRASPSPSNPSSGASAWPSCSGSFSPCRRCPTTATSPPTSSRRPPRARSWERLRGHHRPRLAGRRAPRQPALSHPARRPVAPLGRGLQPRHPHPGDRPRRRRRVDHAPDAESLRPERSCRWRSPASSSSSPCTPAPRVPRDALSSREIENGAPVVMRRGY